MQIHRLISLAAAVLITVFIAGIFSEQTHEEPAVRAHVDASNSRRVAECQVAADRS